MKNTKWQNFKILTVIDKKEKKREIKKEGRREKRIAKKVPDAKKMSQFSITQRPRPYHVNAGGQYTRNLRRKVTTHDILAPLVVTEKLNNHENATKSFKKIRYKLNAKKVGKKTDDFS